MDLPVTHRAACALLYSKYSNTLGLCPESFLAAATIDPEHAFSDPDSRVEDSKINLLCDALEKKSDNAVLGFRIGKQMNLSSWGVVGYLMKYSPNLDTGYRYFEKFVTLLAENRRVKYRKFGSRAVCSVINPCNTRQITWQTIASANLRMLDLISNFEVKPVWISFPRGSIFSSKEIATCLELDVRFGGCEIQICFNTEDVLKKNPDADPYLEQIFLRQAQKQLEVLNGALGLVGQVRNCIALELVTKQLNINRVAASLDISERSLQRHLANEGTSFGKILEQFRADKAYRLLEDRSLPISQISEILGYQSRSSFNRAFHRWQSMSPQQYRDKACSSF